MTETTRIKTGAATISRAFARAKAQRRCALVTYLTVGWPTPADTRGLVMALEAGGADVIELGVPFSDPVADGATIQRAAHAALQAGVTPRACIETVADLRAAGLATPVLLMGYANPIVRYGLRDWVADCVAAGVDGLIIPDLPPEEALPLRAECARRGMAVVFLVAPTTPPARLARIATATQGFLYVVSRLGTTGAEGEREGTEVGSDEAREALRTQLALARAVSPAPVAVGFGLSRPEQVGALAPLADGVIVGSAVVARAVEGPAALQAYVASLRAATACN